MTFFVISGCNIEKSTKTINCEDTPNKCLFLKSENIEISFSGKPLIVEQPYQIQVTSKKQIQSMTLIPITMSMSEIPVYKDTINNENSKTKFETQIMFGVCSVEKMQWQLEILYRDNTLESFKLQTQWS